MSISIMINSDSRDLLAQIRSTYCLEWTAWQRFSAWVINSAISHYLMSRRSVADFVGIRVQSSNLSSPRYRAHMLGRSQDMRKVSLNGKRHMGPIAWRSRHGTQKSAKYFPAVLFNSCMPEKAILGGEAPEVSRILLSGWGGTVEAERASRQRVSTEAADANHNTWVRTGNFFDVA